MKKRTVISLLFFLTGIACVAQNPNCSDNYVYMDGSVGFIKYYDPSLPLSASNPGNTSIPVVGGGGLAFMPNINGGTLSPTFYSVSGGTYWYWDGATWINTGHNTGSSTAANMAGCGGKIYNMVGNTGQVYVYTGTGSGTLLTTVSGFNGGGPYDLVTDCNCNFYVLNTTAPNQGLSIYSSAGVLQCTYNLTGMPSVSGGGGFAIVGDKIYVKNNGFYIGTITGGSVSFTAVPGFNASPGDFASCSVCNPPVTFADASVTDGTLTCTTQTTSISVSTTLSPVFYSWTGPGIVGSTTGSAVVVNIPGTYSCTVGTSGCLPVQSTLVSTVTLIIDQLPPVSLALSNSTLCLYNHNGSPNSVTLTATGASQFTLLTSPNFSTSNPNGTLMPCFPVPSQASLSPVVSATLMGSSGLCSNSVVTSFTIIPNPTLTLSQTSASICPLGSETISASGCDLYTWAGGSGLSAYTGSLVSASPANTSTYTVSGSSAGCSSPVSSLTVTVLPVPLVSINPPFTTICLGSSLILTANGTATSFTWDTSTGQISSIHTSTLSVSPSQSLTYTVTGSLNSCTNVATATVNIVQPPVLSLNLDTYTVCASKANNSPNAVSLVPGGALAYTLDAEPGITVGSPNGPVMTANPSGTSPGVTTVTLTGKSGVCTVTLSQTFTILPNPVITISPASASVCPGNKKAFTASGASQYTWLPMPSYTLTGQNSIVANPTLTSFYKVFGSDNGCNSDVKNAVLVVLPMPQVSVSPGTSTVCSGNSVVLTADGSGLQYEWFPPVNLSSSVGKQVIATPTTVQTYVVKSTLNTCTTQAVATVSVVEIPSVKAVASSSVICSDVSTSIDASGADSFAWLPAAYLNTNAGSKVITTPHQNITYTVHGYNGVCTGSTTISIRTVERPQLELASTGNRVCTGATVTMSVTGADSYTWAPAGAIVPTGSNNRIIAAPKANTQYTVVGANRDGSVACYQEIGYLVLVTPMIYPVVPSSISVCAGQKAGLWAKGGNTYRWFPEEGLNRTKGSEVVASPLVTMIYTVEVSDNTYCGETATIAVQVNPRPLVSAGRDTTYNLSEPVFIEAKGEGVLKWVGGDGIVCADCPLTRIIPSRSNCYYVEAVNEFGCKTFDDVCIDVTEDFTAYIPNTFTPNGDGLNDVFLVYGENISQVSMEVYDRWGVMIFYSEDVYTGWDGTFKGKLCQPGVYTYTIKYTGLNRKKYSRTGNVNIIR